MNESPKWLVELMDEYAHFSEKRSDAAIARLARIFGIYSPAVMSAAVDKYILQNERGYFPTVGELKPFVDSVVETIERMPNDPTPAERRRWHEVQMAKLRVRFEHGDDEIMAFEQRRGTMPTDENIGSEYEQNGVEHGEQTSENQAENVIL